MSPIEPEGDLVTTPPAQVPNIQTTILVGEHVTLTPLTHAHIPDLYTNLGKPEQAHIWRYIPTGPYDGLESFTQAMVDLMESKVFFPFAIMSSNPVHLSNQATSGVQTAVSVITYMNISPTNLSIEIGSVLFAPTLQRTTAATETVYLLMKWAYEVGGYQRVEWKANERNEPSKRAALRLGFTFEGVFRKHLVVKGRRRDTAWFSCLDEEWVDEDGMGVKSTLEGWLGEENFIEGRQVRKLEDFRP